MLYVCIPSYNEAPTIGVLLWRIRRVFKDFSREYEILVYDDGSTDGTAEILRPYLEVAPLTRLGDGKRRGYGHALDQLCREVTKRTRYPRRDGMILMQADFTDQPENIPELVKQFEGGADIVLAERERTGEPRAVRRLRLLAPWALRLPAPVSGLVDPFSSFRLYRISLLKELVRSSGETPIITADGWAANVELLMKTAPLGRRIERVQLAAARYDVRPRESRIRPFSDAVAMYRFGRSARRRGAVRTPMELSKTRASAPEAQS